MKHQVDWRAQVNGMGRFCLVAALGFIMMAVAVADEIDDILAVERMAYEESLVEDMGGVDASGGEAVPEPVADIMDSRAGSGRVRELEAELAQARQEIAQLKETLEVERRTHMLEMRFSYYNMGCVYRAAGEYERAESEFLKALEVDPDDPAVHYNLAILYDDDLGRKADAKRHYEKFLELAPNDPDAAHVLEWLSMMD